MRLLAFGVIFALLLSCSINVHNYEEKVVSNFLKSKFPDGLHYTDGDTADLQMLENKAIAFYFTSVNNPQSLEVEELLKDMAVKYHYRLSIVFINSGPEKTEFEEKVKRHGDSFFMASEKQSKVLTSKYDVKVTPSLIVYGRNKTLVDEKGIDSLIQTFPRIPGHWE